tara:strand:+ start:9218 stop:10474 length:1257 start_codon:yes stop_codon:yes gene_type:complete
MKSNILNISKKNKGVLKVFQIISSSILLIPIILVLLSTYLIATIQRESNYNDFTSHLISGLIGIGLAIFISLVPIDSIKKSVLPAYLISILSLILVNFFGITISGAQRWLDVGLFTFQPSEVAKLTSILALSLTLIRRDLSKFSELLIPIIVIFIPWILIFTQPDLGTSLVLGVVLLLMLYWANMPAQWALIALFIIVSAIISCNLPNLLILWIPFIGYLAYVSSSRKILFPLFSIGIHLAVAFLTPWFWENGLREYQRDRLLLFINPELDPLGGGYHLLQSKIAIGSGGIYGTGVFHGQLTKLKFIPEQHTDFIFSALGEETGFIGCFIVALLFLLLIVKLIRISRTARTDFESFIVIGIVGVFVFQIMVNIFMTIGLGPVTGIPLPFMSYGRTALLINFTCIGLCLSVFKRTRSLR